MKTFSQIRLEQAINLIVDESKPINEISIRCPYCGDSRHNPSATHMGIKFIPSPKVPVPSYHCFRCNESGSINAKFLKDVGIDNKVIKKYLKYKKIYVYNSAPTIKEVKFDRGTYDYKFTQDTDSRQYKYLRDRFKMDFTEDDIKRFKIILNPISFISTFSKEKIKEFDIKIDLKDYIGFLSQDGNQAVFRAIDKDKNPRFYNLTIEETDYRKLYVINNDVDIKKKKFRFVLTEGIFDLIGVYMHFYKDNEDLSDTIFLAALGKSFEEPINRLVQTGFLDFDIYLFADTSEDIDVEFYANLLNNPYVDEVYVATNTKEGEKDFGVSLDRIEFDDFVLFNSRKIKALIAENKNKNKKKV
jgi:hypothetical protein